MPRSPAGPIKLIKQPLKMANFTHVIFSALAYSAIDFLIYSAIGQRRPLRSSDVSVIGSCVREEGSILPRERDHLKMCAMKEGMLLILDIITTSHYPTVG